MILILSVLINLPLFLFTGIQLFCTNDGNTQYYGLALSPLLNSELFSRLFYPTMVIISLLIPWLTCFIIWFFLIRALNLSQNQLNSKNTNTSFTNNRKPDTYFRITLMIVCVLSVYMVCRSAHLFEVTYILLMPLISPQQRASLTQIRIKFYCISNIMLTINHGANFYIYSINPKFRLTLKLYLSYYFRRCQVKRRRAFTLFHLRRKKTNDSLDGLNMPNNFNRSVMLSNPLRCLTYGATGTLKKPDKYIKQFVEQNSNNENSEKSIVWKEIEEHLKKPRH